jgi:hypothetical protein
VGLVPLDSTPGVPFHQLGNTNSQVLEHHRSFVESEVVESLIAAAVAGESLFKMSPVELVENGIRFPVRLFIKEEPHSMSKIRAGKLRLISGVALPDQVKERLLGGKQNEAEIGCWTTCTSRPGVGLDDDSLLAMASVFSDMLVDGPVCSMDIRGWDWSVQEWELFMDAEARRRLMSAGKGSCADFFLRAQAYCVSNSVYVLPSGRMVCQVVPGVQLSGSYWTSSTNSRMRAGASLVARLMANQPIGPTAHATMGDDSVERHLEGVKDALERLGHVVKDVKIGHRLSEIEFCSHRWLDSGLAIPLGAYKTLYRYLSHPPTSASYLDWYTQLAWVLRNFPEWRQIRELAYARAERAIKSHENGSQ